MDYCALELDIPPCLINMTFLEWYQNFLRKFAGYDTYQYGYYMLGNENELIEKYTNADLETKAILYALFLNLSPFIKSAVLSLPF